jgi:hypothetical protein
VCFNFNIKFISKMLFKHLNILIAGRDLLFFENGTLVLVTGYTIWLIIYCCAIALTSPIKFRLIMLILVNYVADTKIWPFINPTLSYQAPFYMSWVIICIKVNHSLPKFMFSLPKLMFSSCSF